ncbi:UNVERIFIED_CONTAM: hypothetical protein Sradi_0154700 [Sesamum radiatum]|uniref:Reverse transcriptase domain-containing protein n=1 Tax=Sesamum radiatum TaxID=300843 RepID=A0AAW2WLB4_SESRA
MDSNMNAEMMKSYTVEEITTVISHMAPLKSPDGMPPIFFQKYWHIIKFDVINCVLNILNDRVLDPTLNFTHIVLIPKIHKPELITHFRPISLCNVIMRITTKCIANRLKPLLDKIITPTQSAFVPSRLITDNILIAFEINHFIKNKTWGKTGHIALKLDISKAYDKVEWNFLRQVYGKASGQEINLENFVIVFSKNTADNLRTDISEGLGIRQAEKHEKYLGLPSVVGRSRKAIFSSLRVKVWKKISSSGEKQLSQADKEILIKVVIQAIPTYAMGVFRLPEGLIRDIEGYRWCIGDGKRARIWIDPWIPNLPSFCPGTLMNPLPPPTTAGKAFGKQRFPIRSRYSVGDYVRPLSRWDRTSLDVSRSLKTIWTTPPIDFLKLNVDAAIFSKDGDIAAGIVAPNNHVICIAWTTIREHRLVSPKAAKTWAARIAIQFTIRHGWTHIIIETDYANLHSYLTHSKRYPSDCEPFIHDVLTLSTVLRSCLFSLVRRTGNALAHSLAKHAVGSTKGSSSLAFPSSELALADLPHL